MKKITAIFFLLFFGLLFAEERDIDGKTTASKNTVLEDKERAAAEKALVSILDEKNAGILAEEGIITSYKYKSSDMEPVLQPFSGLLTGISEFFNTDRSSRFKPVFLMEQLYLHKKEKGVQRDISKILRRISALEGIEYYSHSRGKMRTLYAKSFAVKAVKNGKKTEYEKIPDPLEGDAGGLTVLARQEDLTFGDTIYRYRYFTDGNSCGTVCQNAETLKYSIFRVIAPEHLRVVLAVHDLDGYLVIYCATAADFTKLPGLETKLKNSFSSRSEALYKWFIREYEKETD